MATARRVPWVVFIAAALAAGLAHGEEEPPPVAPPEAASPEAASPEGAAPAPPKDDFAGGGGTGRGGPVMADPGYGAVWYPSRTVAGQGADFGLVRQHLSAAVPVWRDDGDLLLLSAGVRNSLFFTDAVLPDTRRPFPDELWNVNVGLNYVRQFGDGWSGGLSTSVGSASDKPFHSIEEMNVGVFAFLRMPTYNERDSWMFSLTYSPVGAESGNLNFPIPGVAYLWNPSDDLHVSIGLPLSAAWRPVEDLSLNLSYVPLTNVNARATYRASDAVHLYGGFEWVNEAYRLADRPDTNDRFMGFEKRLIGGVRWDVGPHAALDLNAGYAFDRYYGEGHNQFSALRDRVDIASGAFLAGSFLVRW